jgi:farnesyl diphosphate synthase
MNEVFTSLKQRNSSELEKWLETLDHPNLSLVQAMRYSLLSEGKRVRPFLVYATGQILGAAMEDLDTAAASIECIHTYSLIHDDLPAMDDDELRRGHPTCHIKFDEATAILAGDALQTLAFTILSEGKLSPQAEQNRIKMITVLAKASGARGMCLGQALDLNAEGKDISLNQLETIHINKTGELIKASVRLGALSSGDLDTEIATYLDKYAEAIGLAFQVQDDILDVISDTDTLGKPQGSDIKANKSTYPSLLGLKGSEVKAQQLLEDALHALACIPHETQQLEEFARYVIERKK